MTRRIWLIAAREIAAYASVPSFWIALLLGPVLMLLAGLVGLSSHAAGSAPAQTVLIRSADPALREAAARALAAVNPLGAPQLRILDAAQAQRSDSVILLDGDPAATIDVIVQGRPLPLVAGALLERDLLAALRARALHGTDASAAALQSVDAVRVRVAAPPVAATAPSNPDARARVGRFAVVMLLWMNLVGALGMLLQAIVRERSNRTLESLLAAARSTEIIFGKLLGVGVLSILLLAAWLGAGAGVAASPMLAQGQGLLALVLAGFQSPALLVQAGAVYVLAFVMYGAALIGLGAAAKDLPAAQNLSRPVFGVLLLVFFTALTQVTGAVACEPWMTWLPPLTPFVVLMSAPQALSGGQLAGAFAVMALTAVAVSVAASRALTEQPLPRLGRRRTVATA